MISYLRNVIVIFCCLSWATFAQESAPEKPKPVVEKTAEQVAAESVIKAWFAAYTKKDLEAAMALWTADAPGFAERRDLTKTLFESTDSIDVKDMEIRRFRQDGDRLIVRVTVQLVGNDRKTGMQSSSLGKLDRVFELIPFGKTFHIHNFRALGISDVAFRKRVLTATNRRELKKIIEDEFDDPDERTEVVYMAINVGNADQRRRLYENDPYELLANEKFVARLNWLSWNLLLKSTNGDKRSLLKAEFANVLACEIAEFIDNREGLAWQRTLRALICQSKQESEEALKSAHQAVAAFDELKLLEGQAASQIVLGRMLIANGQKVAAAKAFAEADVKFAGVVILTDDNAQKQSLGEIWALRLGEIERLGNESRAARSREDWATSFNLCRKQIEVMREIYGPWHSSIADASWKLGRGAWCISDFRSAADAMQVAVEISEKLYDEGEIKRKLSEARAATARTLLAATVAQWQQFAIAERRLLRAERLTKEKKTDEAIKVWNEIIAQLTAIVGESDYLVADAWFERSYAYENRDDQVKSIYRGLEIYQKHGWTGASEYFEYLNRIVAARFEQAISTMTDKDLTLALEANDHFLDAARRLKKSTKWYEFERHDLQRLLRAPMDERLEIQSCEHQVSDLLNSANGQQGRKSSEPLLQKLAAFFGQESSLYLNVRGISYGRYDADSQFVQAVAEAKSILEIIGPENLKEIPDLCLLPLLMAMNYEKLGEIRQAFDCLRSMSFVDDIPFNSTVYRILAYRTSSRLNLAMGDFAAGKTDGLRSILLWKRILLPTSHPDYYGPVIPLKLDPKFLPSQTVAAEYISLLLNYAQIHSESGSPRLAKEILLAALNILNSCDDKVRQYKNRDALLLNSLGIAFGDLGEMEQAEKYFRQSMELTETRTNDENEVGSQSFNLAILLMRQGHFENAILLFEYTQKILDARKSGTKDVLRIVEKARFLREYGTCQARVNDRQGAIVSLTSSLQLHERVISDVFSLRSEAGAEEALQSFNFACRLLTLLSIVPEAASEDVNASWNWVLRANGRALDTLIQYRQLLRRSVSDPTVIALVDKSSQLRQQMSDLAVNPPADLAKSTIQARIDRLQTELDALIGELNRSASPAHQVMADISLATVQQKLPVDTVLIQFVRMPIKTWPQFGGTKTWSDDRYFAYLLPQGNDIKPSIIDVGNATEIEQKIHDVRELIANAPNQLKYDSETTAEAEYQKTSQELFQLVLEPILAKAGKANSFYVLPDGELHRIAFETLADRAGHYLIEDYQFAYLSSAGDLLRTSDQTSQGTWVFAGPDFDESFDQRGEVTSTLIAANSRGQFDSPVAPDLDVENQDRGKSTGWPALRGAAEELNVIQSTIGDSFGVIHAFTGKQALEDVFKTLHSPRILHLATHGFFAEDVRVVADDSRGGSGASLGIARLMQQRNPFLRSGIVLAGANRLGKESPTGERRVEDGWVTAEEIASLDLQGTELVVLSACESGLGDVKIGEGVKGLRQSFLYAGARTLVTSLYKVPDDETRQLMQHFYTGMKANRGKLKSLREAQLNLLQERRTKKGAAHPYFWGSFVLVGNPN